MEKAVELPRSTALMRSSGGISLSGALSLLAIAAVLVVVSVPRLRQLAVEENEADARSTAQNLARALVVLDPSAPRAVQMRELLRRPELEGLLSDAEVLDHGNLLRRRGYLFEITFLSPSLRVPNAAVELLGGGSGGLRSVPAVRAWPWGHGTGRASFLATSDGATLARAWASSQEGPAAAGAKVDDLAGWKPVH